MRIQIIKEVEEDLRRLQARLADLKKTDSYARGSKTLKDSSCHENWKGYLWGCPETAAVRRASLDLTKSLAKLRRHD
jgi:hypothetical protein